MSVAVDSQPQIDPIRAPRCTRARFRSIPAPICLLVLHGLMITVLVTTRLFLSNHIAEESHSFVPVGQYYLAMFCGITLSFITIAKRCKEGAFLFMYRLSFAACAAVFLLIGILGDRIIEYRVPVALLHGFAQGLYWLPYVNYLIELLDPKHRAKLLSAILLVAQLAGVVSPLIMSRVIAATGSFDSMFFCVSGIAVIGCAGSFLLFTSHHRGEAKYDFSTMLSLRSEHKDLRHVLYATFLLGFSLWGAMDLIIPLLIYQESGSIKMFGSIAAFLPFFEMSSSFSAGRFKADRLRVFGVVAMGSLFCGILILNFWNGLTPVVLYSCISSLCVPLFVIAFDTVGMGVVQRYPEVLSHRTEYIVLREMHLWSGRFLSFSMLIFVTSLINSIFALKLTLFILGLAALSASLYVRRIRKEE